MRVFLRIAFATFVFLGNHPMFAANLTTDELRILQQKMKSASQLTVDFTQTKTNSIRVNQKSKSVGRAMFAKPAKFRWVILKPKADSLIFDGDKLYSVQDDKKTVTSFNAEADRAQEIREVIDLVLDFDALLKRYEIVSSTKEANEKVSLVLKPKKKGALTGLDVRVDGATASVELVKMSFLNKNTSEFEFSNPDRSAVSLDSFQVPKGYKVVKGI